jgi:hypothetical protein
MAEAEEVDPKKKCNSRYAAIDVEIEASTRLLDLHRQQRNSIAAMSMHDTCSTCRSNSPVDL